MIFTVKSGKQKLCLFYFAERLFFIIGPSGFLNVLMFTVCSSQIFAINRDAENPQKFSVEYVKGDIRTYLSTDRLVSTAVIVCLSRLVSVYIRAICFLFLLLFFF